jgi:hypothetical protein
VHVVVGLDPEGRIYLLDLWRRQTASDEWIEAFCDLVTEAGRLGRGEGPDQRWRRPCSRPEAAGTTSIYLSTKLSDAGRQGS